ncbi:hypothetical protein J1N35_019895 [Gossypium stocksii]|uniref:Uncharacterized protein n=1 Tax=Gossypium stocksii TaxID=47602 RepID=A0A9D3VDZ6_9ROSI|nr:hypothetical protein J1N35_019895 [Gossypium stocksii]
MGNIEYESNKIPQLCNPALWSTNLTTPSTTYINGPSLSNNSVLGNGDSTPDGGHHLEMSGTGSSGNCALDEARLRFIHFTLLRTVVAMPSTFRWVLDLAKCWGSNSEPGLT